MVNTPTENHCISRTRSLRLYLILAHGTQRYAQTSTAGISAAFHNKTRQIHGGWASVRIYVNFLIQPHGSLLESEGLSLME